MRIITYRQTCGRGYLSEIERSLYCKDHKYIYHPTCVSATSTPVPINVGNHPTPRDGSVPLIHLYVPLSSRRRSTLIKSRPSAGGDLDLTLPLNLLSKPETSFLPPTPLPPHPLAKFIILFPQPAQCIHGFGFGRSVS